MARFLIFGTLAWDRFVYLDRGLIPGERILGRTDPDPDGAIAGGRAGGASAHAATAWISAGHAVTVAAPVEDGPTGDRVIAEMTGLGVDLQLVQRVRRSGRETLILISPDGERTVLGLMPEEVDRPALMTSYRSRYPQPDPATLENLAPDGVYLRAPFTGWHLPVLGRAQHVIAHIPFGNTDGLLNADILIGSCQDLGADWSPQNAFDRARGMADARLQAVILTDGARGGWLCCAETVAGYDSVQVDQVNATGAGDSFAAGVLEARVAGAGLEEAVRHGARWGAATAAHHPGPERRCDGLYPAWTPVSA